MSRTPTVRGSWSGGVHRRVRPPGQAAHASDDVVGWTPAVDASAGGGGGGAPDGVSTRSACPSPTSSPGSSPARRGVADARCGGRSGRLRPRAVPVDDRRVSTPGWAEAGLRRARPRAPVGCRPGDGAPERGRPVAAWKAHIATLKEPSRRAERRRFDAVRFRGPGTDLTVGLLPHRRLDSGRSPRRIGAVLRAEPSDRGSVHVPDRRRTRERCARPSPLVLVGGTVVRDLEMTLRDGGSQRGHRLYGRDEVRRRGGTRRRASLPGEVALVDERRGSARSGLTFWSTLFDENAASHIAFGTAGPGR